MPTTRYEPESHLSQIIPRPLDRKVAGILTLTALVLTASYYYGPYSRSAGWISSVLRSLGGEDAGTWPQKPSRPPQPILRGELHQRQFWAAAQVVLYLIIPAAFVKLVLREQLADYGLKLSGWHRRLWVYAGAYAVVFPLVLAVRGSRAFQTTYPFYKHAHLSWADFLGWEVPYCLQFFALEFLFRGVLIHGLKHRFGFYSVFIMTVPYCMIHFGKPPLETLGAILAGLFLGTLSLWTRSIWLGTLIHISVAVTMDLAALHSRGQLGNLFG